MSVTSLAEYKERQKYTVEIQDISEEEDCYDNVRIQRKRVLFYGNNRSLLGFIDLNIEISLGERDGYSRNIAQFSASYIASSLNSYPQNIQDIFTQGGSTKVNDATFQRDMLEYAISYVKENFPFTTVLLFMEKEKERLFLDILEGLRIKLRDRIARICGGTESSGSVISLIYR